MKWRVHWNCNTDDPLVRVKFNVFELSFEWFNFMLCWIKPVKVGGGKCYLDRKNQRKGCVKLGKYPNVGDSVCIGYCQSCTFRCYFCESIKELTWPVLLLNCWTLLAKTCLKDDEMLDSRKKNEWKSSLDMSVVEMLQGNFIHIMQVQ